MLGYLSADIICSEKATVFRENSSSKTVSFEEWIKVQGQIPTHSHSCLKLAGMYSCLLWESFWTVPQVWWRVLSSPSTVRRQVFLSRPRFCFSEGMCRRCCLALFSSLVKWSEVKWILCLPSNCRVALWQLISPSISTPTLTLTTKASPQHRELHALLFAISL